MTSIYDAWDNGDRHEIRQQFARREEIIRMAREAGFCVEQIDTFDEVFAPDDSYYTQHPNVGYEVLTGILERFAALVAAPLKERIQDLYQQIERTEKMLDDEYKMGMEAEREACARECEADGLLWGQRYAAAIRARGEQA